MPLALWYNANKENLQSITENDGLYELYMQLKQFEKFWKKVLTFWDVSGKITPVLERQDMNFLETGQKWSETKKFKKKN